MDERAPVRAITAAQVLGILTSTLALFFLVAFVAKSLDAYRLKNWRDRLQAEIAEMVNQRVALEEEVQRRQSQAWIEEALRDAGQVSEGLVSVNIMTATPRPVTYPTPTLLPTPTTPPPSQKSLFSGPHWRAWMRLLWGFD
jgi:cell division protein FtsB